MSVTSLRQGGVEPRKDPSRVAFVDLMALLRREFRCLDVAFGVVVVVAGEIPRPAVNWFVRTASATRTRSAIVEKLALKKKLTRKTSREGNLESQRAFFLCVFRVFFVWERVCACM